MRSVKEWKPAYKIYQWQTYKSSTWKTAHFLINYSRAYTHFSRKNPTPGQRLSQHYSRERAKNSRANLLPFNLKQYPRKIWRLCGASRSWRDWMTLLRTRKWARHWLISMGGLCIFLLGMINIRIWWKLRRMLIKLNRIPSEEPAKRNHRSNSYRQ